MSEFIERAVDFEPLPDSERSADAGSDGRNLEGYAAVFDADTEINSWEGHFKERIARGAFRKTLRERTPVCQFDHGHDTRFGSLPIGAFTTVKEDKHGLLVKARMFEHAEPIREAIAEGAVSGMSFRMKVVRDSWADNKGNELKDRGEILDLLYGGPDAKKRGPLQRTIKEVKLLEAGPVVFPAYTQTTVGVRSMNDDERRQRLADLVREGAGDEEAPEDAPNNTWRGDPDEADGVTLREVMDELGISEAEIIEALRAEASKPKCTCGTKSNDHAKDCPVSKAGKANEKNKKTSSGSSEKKSEDDTSSAPEAGDDAAEPRSEDQDDAAQAGTSTGMTSNARERALRLLDL